MGKLSFSVRRRCDALATRLRVEIGLRAFDPLPARQLAKVDKISATLITPEQLPDLPLELANHLANDKKWDGFIKSFNPLVIVTRANLPPTRVESTVMHEIAHVLLKHPPAHLYITDNEKIYRDHDNHIEAEASFLGSCLQIPSGGIRWARQRGMTKAEIATHFGASEQMAQWRLNAVKY